MLMQNRRDILFAALAAATAPAIARASNSTMIMTTETGRFPQLEPWAQALKQQASGWWPVITRTLASPGYEAPDQILVRFGEISRPDVPAITQGTNIYVSGPYIAGHQDDFGCIAHEMCHVAQGYPKGAGPGWLTEGIADYVRYYVLFPNDPRRVFDPSIISYGRGYQPAAALLDFVERRSGAGSVRRVNAAMRQGSDGGAALTKIAGASLTELWGQYLIARSRAEPS
jgi:hypothetical protein